ncbi:MAG: energy-coupling factor transporter transmembrane protein EcfT [Eubacterium sp.]|nr:energy-coupling factor transporter transmembrane protein EcfT [Eubacterium sp.]
MMDTFSRCHPIINMYYFIVVLGCTMFVQHPVLLILSFAGATSYAIYLKGSKSVIKRNLIFTLPLLIIVACLNPCFNHYGVTQLIYMEESGNWITLEATVYGVVLGAILFVVIEWFGCFNKVMTTDKFVYLFGKLLPAISLLLSMTLRFVPRFLRQLKRIRNAQKCVGMDVTNGGFIKRVKHGLGILSILITWALENAIDTADSMKNRGYGLPGRSAFSIYRFDRRDLMLTGIFSGLFLVIIYGLMHGAAFAQYDPRIILAGFTIQGYAADVTCSEAMARITFVAFAVFCFVPLLMNLAEDVRMKASLGQMGKRIDLTYRAIYEGIDEESSSKTDI